MKHTIIDSPIGELTLVAADGVPTGVYLAEQRQRPPASAIGRPDRLRAVAAANHLERPMARLF